MKNKFVSNLLEFTGQVLFYLLAPVAACYIAWNLSSMRSQVLTHELIQYGGISFLFGYGAAGARILVKGLQLLKIHDTM